MPEFRSDEWQQKKGTLAFPVTPRHMVDIWVSCTKTVQVFGVSGPATTLLKNGSEFRFRGQVKGFDAIRIQGTGQTPFGVKVIESPLQDGEENSGEKPPVIDLPEPSNLVQQMRRLARDHHMSNRYPVLDQDDFRSFGRYEIDEDEEDPLFEEEALAKHQAEKKAKAEAAAKARKEAAAKAAPGAPEPPSEPAPATERAQDPPPAEAAE